MNRLNATMTTLAMLLLGLAFVPSASAVCVFPDTTCVVLQDPDDNPYCAVAVQPGSDETGFYVLCEYTTDDPVPICSAALWDDTTQTNTAVGCVRFGEQGCLIGVFLADGTLNWIDVICP